MATAATKRAAAVDPKDGIALAVATACRITEYLVQNLDDSVWRAEPPDGKGRSIAAIAAHIHNVRLMWLKVAAKGTKLPAKLDWLKVTRAQALKALKESAAALTALVEQGVVEGRVRDFGPDPAGFAAYCISHEAHHRGQIAMLARMLGKPLPFAVNYGMWEWRKR